MWRLFFLRTRWFRVGVHKILRSDDLSLGLHNHPWWLWSFVFWGGYREIYLPSYVDPTTKFWRECALARTRMAGSVQLSSAEYCHAVVATAGGRPCWTLFVTGKRARPWGFPSAGVVIDRRIDGE